MSMSLSKLARGTDNQIYYDEDFRNVLEDHIPYLINQLETEIIPIDPGVASLYIGDFYGLLDSLSIPIHLHWITMRLSGLYSPLEAGADLAVVRVPRPDELERIRVFHMSKSRS